MVDTVLGGLLVLATAVWVGGLIALIVVARVARATLGPAERVAFFRRLGRVYGVVAAAALVLGLACGAVLLRDHRWDGVLIATTVAAAALVAATVVGVLQARLMTRLRQRALSSPGDPVLTDRVRRGARTAGILRGLIGILSFALLALGVVLA